MHLAIIDVDPVASYVLAYAAQRRGHQVVCVHAPSRICTNLPFQPSVVVLALDGAGGESLRSVELVRQALPEAAIIATGQRHLRTQAVALLNSGASEFAMSPYSPHELVLKAEKWASLVARASESETVLRVADLEVNLTGYTAVKNGHHLTLTKLELRLLYCLLEHHPNLAPIERLLTFGWDILCTPDASLIKTHISHLRKKLSDAGGVPFEIQSRQTIGYVISCRAETPD
jgi:two-component system OmpR family response regulator